MTTDEFFDSCMREELRAENRHAQRILANHLRHPDPRDPDRIDFEGEELKCPKSNSHSSPSAVVSSTL